MRSPAESLPAERALRVVAYLALAGFIAIVALHGGTRAVTAEGASFDAALARWTADARVDRVDATFDTLPDVRHRDWLAALAHGGVDVRWTTRNATPIGIETLASGDPSGGTLVLAAGAGDGELTVADALGPVDTVRGARSGVTRLPGEVGVVTVMQAGQAARAVPAAGDARRAVVVAGPAGWETKFVVAALEESGWTVQPRISVSPDRAIGGAAALDTARHAAVVALDSAAAESLAGLEAFARRGGGVILAGDASRSRASAPLVAWRVGQHQVAPIGVPPGDSAWRGGSRFALAVDTSRAIPLPGAAARRHFAGRVMATGYDATWRARMAGGDGGVAAHREWWSRAVASVAARGVSATVSGAAPLASAYDALGAPSAAAIEGGASLPSWLGNVLALIALIAAAAEWIARRRRGAR